MFNFKLFVVGSLGRGGISEAASLGGLGPWLRHVRFTRAKDAKVGKGGGG